MKKNYFIIFLPLILGVISSLFIDSSLYGINLPPFMPPNYVFGLVWSILYLLMGYSLYLVYESSSCVKAFIFQFIFNVTWSFIFFNFKLYLVALIWIIILIMLVINMLLTFILENKKAAIINLPYVLWLLIALYLSSGVFILN